MIINKKKYKTKKLKNSLIQQNGGMKTPGWFKTKSAKEAQTQYKTTFDNLAKANYYGKKHNIATERAEELTKTLETKKKENEARVSQRISDDAELFKGSRIKKAGNAFRWISRKITRGVLRPAYAAGRAFTRRRQLSKEKNALSAQKKINKIVEQLKNNETKPNAANVKSKVNAIRTAFKARKLKFVQNQKNEYNARQNAAKIPALNPDEQKRLTDGEEAIQNLIKEKRVIEINPNLTYAQKKNAIKSKDSVIKKARNSIEYLIIKQQKAQQQLYKPQLTYENLNQARQKSVFSSQSKKLRRGELTNDNKSNQAKSALAKKYSSPKGREKTQKIAGELASKIENYSEEQKQALADITGNYNKKSLVDIYSEINQLKGVSDEDKKLISRYMKRKRVNNILSKTYTPPAKTVSNIVSIGSSSSGVGSISSSGVGSSSSGVGSSSVGVGSSSVGSVEPSKKNMSNESRDTPVTPIVEAEATREEKLKLIKDARNKIELNKRIKSGYITVGTTYSNAEDSEKSSPQNIQTVNQTDYIAVSERIPRTGATAGSKLESKVSKPAIVGKSVSSSAARAVEGVLLSPSTSVASSFYSFL